MTTLLELVTASPAETEAAGERLGRRLRRGDLLLLEGPLGAGKTTLVRGLARGMGAGGDVASPTFQLVRLHRGPIQLAHIDLFRLTRGAELSDLGLEELLDGGVVAVEWGDRLSGAEADRSGRVRLDILGEERRRITLEGPPEWSW
jgi:tRNA threonylcarbamoyladenosine biosynthesis protein TsaE